MTGLNGSTQQITGKLMCFINSFILFFLFSTFIVQTLYSGLRTQTTSAQIDMIQFLA